MNISATLRPISGREANISARLSLNLGNISAKAIFNHFSSCALARLAHGLACSAAAGGASGGASSVVRGYGHKHQPGGARGGQAVLMSSKAVI